MFDLGMVAASEICDSGLGMKQFQKILHSKPKLCLQIKIKRGWIEW